MLQDVEGKNQRPDESIAKIFDTYSKRVEIGKYSHKASLMEIEGNEYNLNIPEDMSIHSKRRSNQYQ